MNILKRIAPVVALLAALLVVSPPAAQSMILKEASTVSSVKSNHKICKNNIVKWIEKAGFTGNSVRIGYAIVMRESNGNPRNITNGVDYGLWQINVPTHPGLSRSALLDPVQNSRIAYRLSKGGKNWRPWGIGVTKSGKVYMDARDYDGIWGDWKKYHWIWEPFIRYYRAYPC